LELFAIGLSFLIAILILDSVLRFLLLYITAQRKGKPQGASHKAPLLSFALVIPAHNEANVIGQTVGYLQRMNYPARNRQVFVIADNCTDATATAARTEGAHCLERWDPANTGKGKALQWFFKEAKGSLQAFDAVVIFDADSRVDPSFLKEISKAFASGARAVQGFVLPVPSHRSPISALAAYSELLSQRIVDMASSQLGWPVPLRGTGMAFRTEMLKELASHLCTRAEDMELSLLAARYGPVAFAPAAIVYDPKPPNSAQVATQRARWLQSQLEIWRYHWRDILHLLIKGNIGELALLFSLLLKPKTLVFSLKAFLLGLSFAIPFHSVWLRNAFVAFLSGAILMDIAYYIIGLAFVDDPRFYAKALLSAPLYVLMWLRGMLIAILSKEPWLRVRD
jgi:cellulose synthase/poly-beta-1,6-N-acetylglucosamine synthase-like glycosyltransferase